MWLNALIISSGRMIIEINQTVIPKITTCQRFLDNEPMNKTILKETSYKITENAHKNKRAEKDKFCLNKIVMIPASPKLNKSIVTKITESPSHFPQRKRYN